MTAASAQRPRLTLLLAAGLVGFFLLQASRLVKEVGYSAYFGRDDPRVDRVVAFNREFQIGLQLLVGFGCADSPRCEEIAEPWTLDFIGRLHSAIEGLPNVLRVTSLLNAPVVTGPLESRALATAGRDGSWELARDWRQLLALGRSQGLMPGTLVSEDGQTAGLVVELQSLESVRMQQSVHDLFALLADFEKELGDEIYMAGEPIWLVCSSDMLERDTLIITVGTFLVMLGVLWILFRDPWMSVLPVVAIGPIFALVQGTTALLGIPVTLLLGVIPPVVMTIALTASVHFLTAFLRCGEGDVNRALVSAAGEVGSACFWAAVTTVAGFSTFLASDLQSFRHVGLLAAIGSALGFVSTLTLLPALISLRARSGAWRPARRRAQRLGERLVATLRTVESRSRLALGAALALFVALAAGMTQLYYDANSGFGERSYVIRAARFIEANLRKSQTLELSVDIPEGARIYDEQPLRLLAEVEQRLERDPFSGRVWSFLDVLEGAYRMDRGVGASSMDELIRSAPRAMPLVVSFEQSSAFWSETTWEDPSGQLRQRDRARVSANRGFLGSETLAYAARMRSTVVELSERYAPFGYAIELEGGIVLLDQFLAALRATQWQSFGAAFGIVSLTLVLLLRRSGLLLVFSGIAANILPVLATLGLMGWAGIGVDPANAMLSTVLLVVVVDDTIHMTLHLQRERAKGSSVREALARCYPVVGEAVVTSSLCLALGCSVMLLADWSGLVSFGLLASLGVMLALAGDLLLLPAALLVSAGRSAHKEDSHHTALW